MRLVLYIFLFSQLLNFLSVFAEKIKKELSELNSIKWEKVEEIKSKPLKKIIWKSYNDDEIYFQNKNEESSLTNKKNNFKEKKIYNSQRKSSRSTITEIEPYLPLNNFLDYLPENNLHYLYMISR